MLILATETSCDETAAALVDARGGLKRPRFRILSNVVSSQIKLHAQYGGVVPGLAARAHEKNLPHVLKLANPKNRKPDLIAVTRGPGLEPCLWRGIEFAQSLAHKLKTPVIGVNHLEGHIYSNWLEIKKPKIGGRKIEFPAICLIVSGGHTELVLMKNYGKYKLLGATRDDAVGEAYDKVARLLGLGYPGGPIIDKIAADYSVSPVPYAFRLPRPMLHTNDYDFSFAGLKTAVLYLIRDLKNQGKKIPRSAIAAEFQQAAVEVLAAKTLKASRDYAAKTIMVSGGVSANSGLRRALSGRQILFPSRELTTDNAVMIALAGYFNWISGRTADGKKLKAEPNLLIG